jgi:predicted HicB family RNase H-like nuclease
MKVMTYKDYVGSTEVSVEDGVVYGKLLGIRDLVTYEADTPAALRAAFEGAVDDYLDDCKLEGRPPDRPYKGSLNVRIGEDLHRRYATEAERLRLSLNELLVRKLQLASVVQDEMWPYATTTVAIDTEGLRLTFDRLIEKIRDMEPLEDAASSKEKTGALRNTQR